LEGDNYIKSILPRGQKKPAEEDNAFSALFTQSPEISLEDVQRTLGISRSTASRRMKEWVREKKVDRVGKTRAIRYRIK